ncbi:MAG: hypothetical protein WAO35_06650 [Terriglobia bacterium]
MVALRMVTMIGKHAEQLTKAVVDELRADPRTPSYHRLELHEDHARVFAVVHNLGEWLDRKSDADTETTYRSLGQRRFGEGVPLAEVVRALMLTRQTICRFIQSEGWMDSALDLRQQVELYTLISRFFERAIYFTVLSYEAEACSAGKMAAHPEPHKRKFAVGWALGRHTNAV